MKKNFQIWNLVGNTTNDKKIWGIETIDFPCAFLSHKGVLIKKKKFFTNKNFSSKSWILSGYAIEVKKANNKSLIKCYRPWVSIITNHLSEYLAKRNHTIEIWDKGVNIIYSLWQDNTQYLGKKLNNNDIKEKLNLILDDKIFNGLEFKDYKNKPNEIISFFSKFLTLNNGDIFTLGPLVITELPKNIKKIKIKTKKINENFLISKG